jgi:hypothetical protein
VSLIVLLKSDESVLGRIEKHFMYPKRAETWDAKFLMVSKSALHIARESH